MSRRIMSDGSPENDLGNPGGEMTIWGAWVTVIYISYAPPKSSDHRRSKKNKFNFKLRNPLSLDPTRPNPQSPV